MTPGPEPFRGSLPMACAACGRNLHKECRKGCKKCHPSENISHPIVAEGLKENESTETSSPRQPKRTNLKDPLSTGRKRAAEIYPLDRNSPCEWRGLRNCGGGLRPIIGCYDGNQQHRHHGPVKKTTRNESGNVHRICDDCHVHWHELNDLIYDESKYNLLPHDPVEASTEELVQNKLAWVSGEMAKRFELASAHNKKPHDDEVD